MIFSGVPWPAVLPLAAFAMIWGIMVSKAEAEKRVKRKKHKKHGKG